MESDRLVVTAKDVLADDVVALTLARPDGGRLPDWAPGAHIDLVLAGDLVRQYSLCGDRWDPYSYRIAVLREPAGRGGSASVHDSLAVGSVVGFGGPRNHFALPPSTRYVFVAGGIGITPILPMIVTARAVGAEWTLLYGGRRRSSMAFADDLVGTDPARVRLVPEDTEGLLPLASALGQARDDTVIACCGPAPLLAAVEEVVGNSGWAPHRLRLERFTTDTLAPPVRDTPFTVELARTGASVVVEPGISVLDAVRGAGAVTLSSCERGTCGTCETGVLAGVPDHRDQILADHERAAGDCLFPCVSRAASDRLVLDL